MMKIMVVCVRNREKEEIGGRSRMCIVGEGYETNYI
jgi:hypothetical protein